MKDWCEKCLHQKINWYMTFQNCNDSNEYVFHCGKPCPYRKYVCIAFFSCASQKKGRRRKSNKKWKPHWSMSKPSFSLADLMILQFVWHSMFYELRLTDWPFLTENQSENERKKHIIHIWYMIFLVGAIFLFFKEPPN